MHNYYKAGEWNGTCDVCSQKIKSGIMKQRWDGFLVCPSCFEERHPQDFVRARQDKISVPFSRPRPVDLSTFVCTLASSSSYVGLAVAGCARAGETYGMSYFELMDYTYCSVSNRTGISGLCVAGCAIPAYNIDAYF